MAFLRSSNRDKEPRTIRALREAEGEGERGRERDKFERVGWILTSVDEPVMILRVRPVGVAFLRKSDGSDTF